MQLVQRLFKNYVFVLLFFGASFAWCSQAPKKKLFTQEELYHKKTVIQLAEDIVQDMEKNELVKEKRQKYLLNEAIFLGVVQSQAIIKGVLIAEQRGQSSSPHLIADVQHYALHNADVALTTAQSCESKEQQDRFYRQLGENMLLAAQLQKKYTEKLNEQG